MALFRLEQSGSNLVSRIVSILLLAPPLLAAIHYGSVWYDLVIVAASGIMMWEWHRLCAGSKREGVTMAVMAASLIAVLALSLLPLPPVGAIMAGCAGALAVGCINWERGQRTSAVLLAAGPLIVGAFALSWLWLRDLGDGRLIVFWLIGAIWSTDIGAYASGRIIGGPRLAPRISPGKTWAGLVGGILAAILWSMLWAGWVEAVALGTAIVGGIAIALLAQCGDLSVSAVKRRSGVKDSGRLIPGHGGLLDRTDAMLLTGPALALFLWYSRQT